MAPKLGHFGKWIRNAYERSEMCFGRMGKISWTEVLHRQGWKEHSKEGRVAGLVICGVGTVLYSMLLKERWKDRSDGKTTKKK